MLTELIDKDLLKKIFTLNIFILIIIKSVSEKNNLRDLIKFFFKFWLSLIFLHK
jgi:hypothetical protein